MPSRHKRKTKSLVSKATELAFAVPQVVAHRVTRMAIAGPSVSERDRKEFQRMGAEKPTAFIECWNAMIMQALIANQALAAFFFRSFWSPALKGRSSTSAVATQLQGARLAFWAKAWPPCVGKQQQTPSV